MVLATTPVTLPPSWENHPLTVLGLSKSGCAVAQYVAKRGGSLFLSEMLPATDRNAKPRETLTTLGVDVETGGHSDRCFTHAPFVVTSPGIPPYGSLLEQLRQSHIPVISEVELAWLESQRLPNSPTWVGVTGTNGKTTTTTLIGELLKAVHPNTAVCGNIGTPVLDVLDTEQAPTHLAVELSSFQLAYSPSLAPAISVFTNLTPDHINWHGSLEAYKAAKISLFTKQTSTAAEPPRWVVLNADDPICQTVGGNTPHPIAWFSRSGLAKSQTGATLSPNGAVIWQQPGQPTETLFDIATVQLRGAHNQENILAAVAVAKLSGLPNDIIAKVCQTFTGVEHRLEVVGQLAVPSDSEPKTVTVINDSKATNVLASVAAVGAFAGDRPWVIVGGRPKADPIEPLADALQQHASGVVVYGEAQSTFLHAFADIKIPCFGTETLDEAVDLSMAKLGGANSTVLLLTPACASFDQYPDFEHRGNAFKQIIAKASVQKGSETLSPAEVS